MRIVCGSLLTTRHIHTKMHRANAATVSKHDHEPVGMAQFNNFKFVWLTPLLFLYSVAANFLPYSLIASATPYELEKHMFSLISAFYVAFSSPIYTRTSLKSIYFLRYWFLCCFFLSNFRPNKLKKHIFSSTLAFYVAFSSPIYTRTNSKGIYFLRYRLFMLLFTAYDIRHS